MSYCGAHHPFCAVLKCYLKCSMSFGGDQIGQDKNHKPLARLNVHQINYLVYQYVWYILISLLALKLLVASRRSKGRHDCDATKLDLDGDIRILEQVRRTEHPYNDIAVYQWTPALV